MNEENFILKLTQGDSAAYRKLIDELGDKIFITINTLLQNTKDTKDVTQEVFMQTFKSIHSFKGKSSLYTCVHRIAVNKSYDYLKKKKRIKYFAKTSPLFVVESILPLKDKPHYDHPGTQLENKELSAKLFHAINKLQESQRTAFTLRKIKGLSYIEISNIMHRSIPSIESLIFNATRNIRKELRNYYEKNLS